MLETIQNILKPLNSRFYQKTLEKPSKSTATSSENFSSIKNAFINQK